MRANWKLGQCCVARDNVCSHPRLQPSTPIYPRPQHPAPRAKCSHVFSKSKESRPYFKFPQLKARVGDRMGEPRTLLTLGPKSPLDTESTAVGVLGEMAVRWFVETQAELLLHTGCFPEWFHGFVLRKEAENLLQNKGLGHYLIRLSNRATGYILSYRGRDRCRHFVIHRLKDGQYIIDGSTQTHRGLAALIDYYMTEAIQPFGELLTQACSQYDGRDMYDHISFSTSGSSCWSELEVREAAAWRAGGPQPREQEAPSERQRRRPPAIPPKASRLSNNERLVASTNISCEDAAAAAAMLPNNEKQVETKYGRVLKRVAALGEGVVGWTSVPLPLPRDQGRDRRPPPPQWEPNDSIYTLAVKPQPRYRQALAGETVDVVYTEVAVAQWQKASDRPLASGSVTAGWGSPAPETRNPETPPRLNGRAEPPSPSHLPPKARRSPRPAPQPPLPHPANVAQRPPHSAYRSGKMPSDNTYQHLDVAPAMRSQAKPDKEETRKRWFSDWKCK
ncbi:uncharacterized protein sh2d7 [Rhinoraja longicauda]